MIGVGFRRAVGSSPVACCKGPTKSTFWHSGVCSICFTPGLECRGTAFMLLPTSSHENNSFSPTCLCIQDSKGEKCSVGLSICDCISCPVLPIVEKDSCFPFPFCHPWGSHGMECLFPFISFPNWSDVNVLSLLPGYGAGKRFPLSHKVDEVECFPSMLYRVEEWTPSPLTHFFFPPGHLYFPCLRGGTCSSCRGSCWGQASGGKGLAAVSS